MWLACQLPDKADRSLSLWTCAELARTLIRDGILDEISPQSVQRILESQKLKPWRIHHWLSSKVRRDEEFYKRTLNICDLYTHPLSDWKQVWCLDEKTSIQPPHPRATLYKLHRLAEPRPGKFQWG